MASPSLRPSKQAVTGKPATIKRIKKVRSPRRTFLRLMLPLPSAFAPSSVFHLSGSQLFLNSPFTEVAVSLARFSAVGSVVTEAPRETVRDPKVEPLLAQRLSEQLALVDHERQMPF